MGEAVDSVFHQEIVSLICKAALDPVEWTGVLARLSAEFGGMKSHLVSYDMLSSQATPNFIGGFDPEFARQYFDHYQFTNPWAPKWAQIAVGEFATSREILSQDELESTAFFHEWVRPQENAQAGGGIVLVREPTRAFMLGGNLPLAEVDRSQAAFGTAINLLAPLLRHAIEVNRMLGGYRIDALALRAGVEPDTAAIVVLAADMTVLNCNIAAERLIESGNLLAMGPPGRLRLRTGSAQDKLAACLAGCRAGHPALAAGFAAFAGMQAHSCRIVPIAPDTAQMLSMGLLRRERAVALLMVLPDQVTPNRSGQLATRFGFSQAEAAVALLLHNGLGPAEIAAQRGVSIHTVRNQIKSALSKSDSRRQADLTRLIESLGR